MELSELRKNWDAFGKADPLWAILSWPEKQYGGWDPAEFFASGQVEIDKTMRYIDSLGVSLRRGRALDFGCGVGRLTQALCGYFDECYGVDIAASMIEHARRFNRHGGQCRYVLNEAADLSVFLDNHFDFIYSFIVLQHMEPRYIRRYLEDFLRILAPGGLAYFQIPGERLELAFDELPPSACRARITLLEPPRTVRAGADAVVRAKVENVGDVTWPSVGPAAVKRQINLGNKWLDEAGNVMHEGGRAILPKGLAPGQHVELPLRVRAPGVRGRYLLEVDMVQENVTWFKDRGSQVVRAPIHVKRQGPPLSEAVRTFFRRERLQPTTHADEPTMEGHVLPEPDVRQLVLENGGRLVDVQSFVGGDFQHYFYCMTK